MENTQNLKKKPPKKDLENILFVRSRPDRYGQNSILWIFFSYLSTFLNFPLYHNCSEYCKRYKQNVFHIILKKYSKPYPPEFINKKIKYPPKTFSKSINYISTLTSKPFPDIFCKSKLHLDILSHFEQKKTEKKWYIPKNIRKSIIIHVRLDDVYHNPNGSKQSFIGHDKLTELIKYTSKYNKNIYLMVCPNKKDIEICNNAIKRSQIKCQILSNEDIDLDIYLMSQCKLLIMSRSVFSLVGGLLNRNTSYTYEIWRNFNDFIGYSTDGKVFNSEKFKVLPGFTEMYENKLKLDYDRLSDRKKHKISKKIKAKNLRKELRELERQKKRESRLDS